MTHRAFMPRETDPVVVQMGEALFRASLGDRVDLGDGRSVHAFLLEAGWRGFGRDGSAEAAVDYARARLQRRAALRDNLVGGPAALAFVLLLALAIATLLAAAAGTATAAEADPPPRLVAGLAVASIPVLAFALFLAAGIWASLRSAPRRAKVEDETPYGDTTRYQEPSP